LTLRGRKRKEGGAGEGRESQTNEDASPWERASPLREQGEGKKPGVVVRRKKNRVREKKGKVIKESISKNRKLCGKQEEKG